MSDRPLNRDSSTRALRRLGHQVADQVAGIERDAGGAQRLDEIASLHAHGIGLSHTAGEIDVMVKSSMLHRRHQRRARVVVGLAGVHRHRAARAS